MPNDWSNDLPGIRPRKQRKAAKAKKPGSGGGSRGTTVGMALVFGLPALAFFGTLGYCIFEKVTT
jgi:hypothetical protein